MTQSTKLCRILMVALVLMSAASALAAATDQTTTITVTNVTNPTLILILEKGPKGVTPPPATVPPSQDGKFVIGPQLAGEGALPSGLKTYDCGDGVYVVAPANLPIDEIPCPKKNKPKLLGYIPPGGSATIDGQTHTLTVTSGGAGGGAVKLPPTTHLVSVQFGGNVGGKVFSGVNNCGSFVAVFPGATCSSGNKGFAGGVDGSVLFGGIAGLYADLARTNSISRSATATTTGGSLGENSKAGTTLEMIGGTVLLPALGPFTFSLDVAAAIQQIRQTETQTLTSGSNISTITTHPHVDTVGPAGGARIQFRVTKHVGVQGGYQYIIGTHKPGVNDRNQLITGGVYITLP